MRKTRAPRPDQQFDCKMCGRHIVSTFSAHTNICVTCKNIPGWQFNPRLVAILDRPRHTNEGQK